MRAKDRPGESLAPPSSAHRERLRPGLAWIPANAAGFAVGITAWEVVFPALRPLVSRLLGGWLGIAAFGATLGICAGVAQWLVLFCHHPRVWAWAWAWAALVGYAIGFVAGAWASDALTHAFYGGVSDYLSDAVEDLTFGILLGLAVGLGRWLILRRAAPSGAMWWIAASAAALAVGYSSTLGIAQLLPPYQEPLFGAIFGLFAGAITGFVEWLMLGRRMHASGVRSAV